MKYSPAAVSQTTKILFPILIRHHRRPGGPRSVSLVGFLMFGNLIQKIRRPQQPLQARLERPG